MAEAMMPHEAVKEKTAVLPARTVTRPTEKEQKKPAKPKASSAANVTPAKTVTNANSSVSAPAGFNKEALLILREINSNITQTNENVADLSTRVDALYNEDEYNTAESGFDTYETFENPCDEGMEDSASASTSSGSKRQLEDEENVFLSYAKRFKKSDVTDVPVNPGLAELINSSFREGMSDDTYSEISKTVLRPENCETLVETRVNPGVWTVLRPQTQSEDSKMRGIQNCIIKAGCCVAKLLEKQAETEDDSSLELGMNTISLLGNANRWINVRCKELHKKDMDPRIHHLCSASLPYTNMLYGDSIVKDIKDIQEINKISRNVTYVGTRGVRSRPFTRGGRGGRARGQFRGPRRGYGYARTHGYGPTQGASGKAKNFFKEAAKKQN